MQLNSFNIFDLLPNKNGDMYLDIASSAELSDVSAL